MLSRGISKAVLDGDVTPMSLCRNVQVPTHVLYADEIMVFCKGSKRNLRCLMEIFKSYWEMSGQLINKQKSKFYSGAISNARLLMITNLLGFGAGTIPLNYLGCPIFVGKPKSTHFSAIADKFRVKLASWKGALLSIMGRVQLVRAIVHGNEQWAVMCRARFLKWGQPSNTFLKSSIWHGIKHHIATVKANSRWLIGTASIVHRNAAVHARIFKIVVPRYALPDKLVWCPSKDGAVLLFQCVTFAFLTWKPPHTCSCHVTLQLIFGHGWSQMLKQVPIAAVLHVLKALAAIQLSAQLIVGSPKADEQPILQLLAATTSTAVTPSIVTKIVMWCTPSIGWMKVNTDGSVNSSSAACGGLFRDYMANFRGGYAQKISTLNVPVTAVRHVPVTAEM
ncbi:hypothetical protein TSUD_275290 [Trifolium subterraneum]|uniref:Reverse transcriptase domain-containing protein n=1 Tax=Trifolium subterraneum TaxID=3900 RepID=A0A2Z6P7Z0_TRISU|nr:hypothetical protein TSUD_275290 [Trifolium subterraneum]